MAIRVVEFSSGGYKIRKIFAQESTRKFLNFENWTNGEPQQFAKIRVFKVDYFDFHVKN